MTTDKQNFSYSSNLQLPQTPQTSNPELYSELLKIYNAIEILADTSGADITELLAFLAKFRSNRVVTESGLILKSDGTVLVDDTVYNIVMQLPDYTDIIGYRFDIKKVSKATGHSVTLIGATVEGNEQLIDNKVGGIKVSSMSSYTVKATVDGWVII